MPRAWLLLLSILGPAPASAPQAAHYGDAPGMIGPVPIADVGAALFADPKPWPQVLVVSSIWMPKVPARIVCDWTQETPTARWVDPKDRTREVGGTLYHIEFDLLPDGGHGPRDRYSHPPIGPAEGPGEYVAIFDGKGPPRIIPASEGNNLDSDRVAFLCAKDDRVALVVAQLGGGGKIVVFQKKGGPWVKVAWAVAWIE